MDLLEHSLRKKKKPVVVEGVNPGGGSYDFVGLESPSGPGPPSSVIQAGLIDTLVRETFGGRGVGEKRGRNEAAWLL